MPRPGPRPYECVRRAWHSDRHQPIRGSLIQELFRVANEVHSKATQKNKEWQEKLPFVVLKAEEIMYSKANSEAEYMDLKTLWERANDAIDTIIRKDDSTESGDLLQPCIEAALNLGCVPRRASRSQRHNSPRCYLSSGVQESHDTSTPSPCVSDGKIRPHGPSLRLPLPVAPPVNLQNSAHPFVAWYPSLGSPVPGNCGSLIPGGSVTNTTFTKEWKESQPISCTEFPLPSAETGHPEQDKHPYYPFEACTWSSPGRVYPLYYYANHRYTKSRSPLPNLASSDCEILAASTSTHVMEDEAGCLHNFLAVNSDKGALIETLKIGNMSGYTVDLECDLSLRLGPPSNSCLVADNVWSNDVEEVGSSSSHGGSKFHNFTCSPRSFESIRCQP